MKSILIAMVSLISSIGFAQECLNVDYKVRGYFYAGTAEQDTISPGGFAGCSNTPKPLLQKLRSRSTADALQILVTDEATNFTEQYKGMKVYVVNTTENTIGLGAQDSRLKLKRQVFHEGQWNDIEYLPSSWCGNSYHQVYIKSNQYWEFTAPCLEGEIIAKFRFELAVNNELTIYSNEFEGSFNKSQLKEEQGHTANNIMDPYDN